MKTADKLTIGDIARMAGVSKGSVSRVINHDPHGVSEGTRIRIWNIIEETGYVPNRLASGITNSISKTIGLIIPDIQNMFFAQISRSVQDFAAENGYTVFLCNSDSDIEKERTYIKTFAEKQVDGILINNCGENIGERTAKILERSGIPIVILDRRVSDFVSAPGIYADNEAGAYDGVNYLIKTGCRRVLFQGGPEGITTTMERLEGYRRAMSDAGLEIRTEDITFGDYSAASGCKRTLEFLDNGIKPDAVFAGSDTIAIGVIKALNERGIKVPEEVSVLGFDGISFGEDVSPALTTVAQPIYEMGRHATKILFSMIRGEEYPNTVEAFKTSLIIRESTR